MKVICYYCCSMENINIVRTLYRLSVSELRFGGRRQSVMIVRSRERRTIGTTSPIQTIVGKSANANNAAFTTLSRAHSYDRSLVRSGVTLTFFRRYKRSD